MHDLAVYLRLAPEFGGTRFGPFEGLEVRLGSDRDRCHIVIPESLGVLGEHVKLIRQDANNIVITPADRTAAVFLWKPGDRRPSPVHTPTAVRPGDAFSLVTAEGPRFLVELDVLPPEVQAQRQQAAHKAKTGIGRLNADSMAAEGKRQLFTRLLVLGPVQIAQRALTFVRSGAIFQPRNIFLGLTLLSGFIFGGWQGCSARKLTKQLGTTQTTLTDCQETLAGVKSGGGPLDMGFSDLVGAVTYSPGLTGALKKDDELTEAVKQAAKLYMSEPSLFRWALDAKGDRQSAQFADWRDKVVASKKLDNDSKVLLAWLAAGADKTQASWARRENSDGADTCRRGPLRISYRQAVHLGLEAGVDAYARGGEVGVPEVDKQKALLQATADSAELPLPEALEVSFEATEDGVGGCFFDSTITDEREKSTDLLRRVEAALGPKVTGLPAELSSGPIARVAAFFAADLPDVRFDEKKGWEGIDFTAGSLSSRLRKKESRGEWVKARTAEVIAQAVVVPCLAVLSKKESVKKAVIGEKGYTAPTEFNCLVLNYKLTSEVE